MLTGGHAHVDGGRFYEPTVLVDVDHTMDIMREETFGPTVPIMRVADVEEAVRLANDSAYGLQASVWTRDTARGEEIARRLESGVVCVNAAQVNYYALNLPMGGWKASGLSARHGAGGIRKYCRIQSLLVSGFGPRRELYMFPYRARCDAPVRAAVPRHVRARQARLRRSASAARAGARICYQLVTSTRDLLIVCDYWALKPRNCGPAPRNPQNAGLYGC